MLTIVFFGILALTKIHGFYLPGVAPHEYEFGEPINVKVNSLESVETQLDYEYYKLPFCTPLKIKQEAENIGEIISGDRIENSLFKVQMKTPLDCQILCKKSYSKHDLSAFHQKIIDKYRVNLMVENFPAAQKFKTITSDGTKQTEDYVYERGYPLGSVSSTPGKQTIVLHNHVDLVLLYHDGESTESGGRIVGFEVQPKSIKHQVQGTWNDQNPEVNSVSCASNLEPMVIADPKISDKLDVIWTYSVIFQPSDVRWASRWDAYLKMQDPQIHWFSILNSFMIVIFLSGMVAIILMRALHKDLRRYNADPEEQEHEQEERGWKLIYGDVFRTPSYPSLFATVVGSGVQMYAMSLLTIVFAALGFLSPANRGALMTTLVLLFVFMGIFAGYYSACCYKMFGETEWQKNTLQTALLFPGFIGILLFILNLFVWHTDSTGAIPFGTMCSLLALWFGISVPLVYLGAYFGYKKNPPEFPCRTHELLRMIPPQPWYMQKYFAILVGGVLPFGAIFIELFFIMSSVWLHHYYYMFGFLLLVFLILTLTSAEITIVMTYFQLCSEDHQWWWRSIFTAGSSALYLFLYSILYFYTKLEIATFVPTLIYFMYMFIISVAFFVVSGTIGFYATFYFIMQIYGALKIE